MIKCASLVKFKLFQQFKIANFYLGRIFAGLNIFQLPTSSIKNDHEE